MNFNVALWADIDRLQEKDIKELLHDSRDHLWIRTDAHIYRYDGYDVEPIYSAHEEHEYSNRRLGTQLTEDALGRVWYVRPGSKLSVYNPDTRQFTPFTPFTPSVSRTFNLEEENATAIYADDSGYVWVGFSNGHVAMINARTNSIEQFFSNNGATKSEDMVVGINKLGIRGIWFARQDGSYFICETSLSNCQERRILTKGGGTGSSIRPIALLTDRSGDLWLGTFSHGAYVLNTLGEIKTHYYHVPQDRTSLSSNEVRSLFQDDKNRIWISTDKGINILKPDNTFKRLQEGNSDLVNDKVQTVIQGTGSNFWIASFEGLNIISESNFETYDEYAGLPYSVITSFAEQDDQHIWVGTYRGVARLDLNSRGILNVETVFPDFKLADPRVTCLLYVEPFLWIGYRSSGLERLNLETGESKKINRLTESALESNSISALLQIDEKQILALTFGGGAYQFDLSGNVLHKLHVELSASSQLNTNQLLSATKLRNSQILIGSVRGLNKWDPDTGRIEHIEIRTELNGTEFFPEVNVIREDSDMNVWMGNDRGGLFVWRSLGKTGMAPLFERVSSAPLLSTRAIYTLEKDADGFLWAGTNNGLVRLDPKNYQTKWFSRNDGLQGNNFNFAASLRDRAGYLYFGGNRGFSRFNPNEILENSTPPNLRLVDIEIGGKRVPYDPAYTELQELVLTHKDYLADFQFSAFDFVDPNRTHYKYKLENFDDDWIDIGSRHNASFTSLPSGHYTLRVIGANSDGVWNHDGISLPIRVLPAPWLTWWAFSIYGALVLALLLFARKFYGTYLLKEKAREYAANLHHTAERAMDDLQDQLHIEQELVKNIHQHAESTLKIISGFLARQAESIDDDSILETFEENQQRFHCLQLLEDNVYYSGERLVVNFHLFIESLYREHVEGANKQDLEIVAINDTLDTLVPAEIAIPAAVITNELVINSLKHAFEEKQGIQTVAVFLRESVDYQNWLLEVSDSGVGLPASIDPEIPTSIGMEIIHGFSRQVNAKMEVQRDNGTRFRFEIPKPASVQSSL
jgi:two-component sensor histidine kinase/ligand-binding sensor domain-containing protein